MIDGFFYFIGMENWFDIPGFNNNYEVSDLGNIRRKKGTSHLKQKNRKFFLDKDGYEMVNLKVNQKSHVTRVHRILATVFIPNPENKPLVNHKNGIKNDNRLENLEWSTLSENRVHAYSTGLQNGLSRRGEKCNFTKLTKEQVIEIRNTYKKGVVTMLSISKKYDVSVSAIRSIIIRENWSWL